MNTVTLGGTATINDLVSVARFGAKSRFPKNMKSASTTAAPMSTASATKARPSMA